MMQFYMSDNLGLQVSKIMMCTEITKALCQSN